MMYVCRCQSLPTILLAASVLTAIAGCSSNRDATSGSTTGRVAIANTTTADYEGYGERQPGTNWGMSDPYNVRCFGACRTEAGSGS